MGVKLSPRLPTSCFRIAIFSILEKHRLFDPNGISSLNAIYRILSTVGNVSHKFRALSLQAIANFIFHTKPVFFLPKSSLSKLQSLLPNSYFSIATNVLSSTVLSSSLNIESIKVLRIVTRSKDDVDRIRLSVGQVVEKFLKNGNFHNVRHFEIQNTCDCSQWFCEMLTIQLPALDSLVLSDTMEIDYSSFMGRTPPEREVFVFPKPLNKLSSLKIGMLCAENPYKSFDVSNLSNLVQFSLSTNTGSSLVGLGCLTRLKDLELWGFVKSDPLHSSVRLDNATLVNIGADCLAVFFSNQRNFKNCRLSLKSTINEHPGKKILKRNLVQLTCGLKFNGYRFFLSNTPQLEELEIRAADNLSVHFDYNNRLSILSLYGLSETNHFYFCSPLFITKLVCQELSYRTLFYVLSNCPYIRHLELDVFMEDFSVYDVPNFKLDHLTYLKVNEVECVHYWMPVVPKLTTMILKLVDEFDLGVCNSKFPAVKKLELIGCGLIGNVPRLNHTVEHLLIDHSIQSTTSPSCLSHFVGVKQFTFKVGLSHRFTLPSCSRFSFPPNIETLHCVAPFEFIQHSFLNLDKLVFVNGKIWWFQHEEVEATNWFSKLTSRRTLSCTLKSENHGRLLRR
ncbi:hypothetical protein RCL1_004630 [Eukaryota sp. TZLM3-RCL]